MASPRRIPRQPRGQRRVAGLLCAAASVIAETGYEKTTMSAIAKRARSSIGSLYQFFPNKEAVADSLRSTYVSEIDKMWSGMESAAAGATPARLAHRLIRSQLTFAEEHPAFLALFEAPPTKNTSSRREMMRARIARLLLASHGHIGRRKALLAASVVQVIIGGLLRLYGRAKKSERDGVEHEFETVLAGYLSSLTSRSAGAEDHPVTAGRLEGQASAAWVAGASLKDKGATN